MIANPTHRFTFLGVPINATFPDEVIALLEQSAPTPTRYVCFPDSFVIREALRNEELASILQHSWMTLPDGKPSQWFANAIGLRAVQTVSGYHVCRAMLDGNATHFFYGGTPELLYALEKRIRQEFPQANILGMKAPPMVSVADITNNSEIQADLAYISSLRPHFIWIGISSPKQDFLMHHASSQLSTGILLGIGGVFNYLAYPETKSPEWMKRMGLRWLYRAVREPRRLAGKYLGMLAFILTKSPRIIADILRQRGQGN